MRVEKLGLDVVDLAKDPNAAGPLAKSATPGSNLAKALSFLFVACLLALIAPIWNSKCLGQSDDLSVQQDTDWQFRYELFQMLLAKRGLDTSMFINDAMLKPKQSVVVLLGDQGKVSEGTWSGLRRFIARGGNLLLASDRTSPVRGIGMLDVGVSNAGPVSSDNSIYRYQGFSDCLLIEDVVQDHPITKGIKSLVTNRSGWLTRPSSLRGKTDAWQGLAFFPNEVTPSNSQSQPLVALSRDKNPEAGSAIVVADASIFTNSMLWHGDNGLLALQTADWLCKPDRKTLVYIVDGVPMGNNLKPRVDRNRETKQDQGQLPRTEQTEVKVKPESMLKFANIAIQKLAESNIANEALKNQPRGMSPKMVFQGLWGTIAAICGLGLVMLLLSRTALMTPFLNARKMRSAHTIQANQHHVLDQNSFAAESLARDFCRKWIGKDSHASWHNYLQDIELQPRQNSLTAGEKSSVKSIIELAVYGKKSLYSDDQLVQLGKAIRDLLIKHPCSV
jgi:hypothetical protein